MKTVISLLSIALALGLTGCSDPAPPAKASKPAQAAQTAVSPGDLLDDQVKKALLVGSTEDLQADRSLLREWRRGGEVSEDKWPGCDAVAQKYGAVSDLKTLAGVRDALAAAQVDDYVLCDEPKIFAAAKVGAEAAIKRLAEDLPAQQAAAKLADDPKAHKMEQCWLESLRDTRQNGSPYNQATERAEARCTKK